MKSFLKIFAVFLLIFYAENSIAASITICGEEYKLNIPILSKNTVSFEDKYGDKVSIYKLTNDFFNEIDNRTKNIELKNEYYIYVKDNKTFAISHNKSFIFLDYNFDSCNFNKDIEKTDKIKPFSTSLGFDYSNVLGFDMDFGYLGDNDSLGVYNPNFEYNNSLIDNKLMELLNAASEQDTGMVIFSTNSELDESSEYDADEEYSEDEYDIYYDSYAVSSYFIKALYNTLEQGINSLFVDDSSDKMSYIFSHTTPLMLAVYAGYNDIAEYLLEHGANPAYYNNGADALCFAVLTNNKNMIYKLVESGAPVILEKQYQSYAIPLALYAAPTNMTVTLKELIDSVLEEKEKDFLYKNAQ